MSNITTGLPTLNSTYSISVSNLPSMSSNSTFVNQYIAYVDDDVNLNNNIVTNTIYAPISNEHSGFTGTHGPYFLSGPSGPTGPTTLVNYNLFGYSNGYSGGYLDIYSDYQYQSNIIFRNPGPYCNDTIIKNIKHIGLRNIPINSTDIITYEDINEGDTNFYIESL